MSKVLRYLRIVFSALCGIACVLLIALWARSYWSGDAISWRLSKDKSFALISNGGHITFYHKKFRNYVDPTRSLDSSVSYFTLPVRTETSYGFDFVNNWGLLSVDVPDWFLVLLSASLAAVPWLRWRFSLSTLLIAMTAVAVVLGFIVWSVR